jgi:hypothetical protein
MCLARGGHHWRTTHDGAGSLTWCVRFGQHRHSRPVVADIDHRTQVNLAYEVVLRESPDSEVIEESSSG